MLHRNILYLGLWIALTLATAASAQRTTLLSPANITYRGVSIADSTHSMLVGDSATILMNTSPNEESSGFQISFRLRAAEATHSTESAITIAFTPSSLPMRDSSSNRPMWVSHGIHPAQE